MYCGDETGAFVGDVGRDTCRFGYGGEDIPKVVTSSYAPTTCSLLHPRTEDVKPLYKNNTDEMDWDVWQSVWEYGMTTLRVHDGYKHTNHERTEHPLMAVSDTSNSNMLEILMETWQTPACFVAPTSMCASFAMGRQTSLVVDVGHEGTRVTPIVDGIPLHHSQRTNRRGGSFLNSIQQHMIETTIQPNKKITPRYQLSPRYKHAEKQQQNNNTNTHTPNFHQFAMNQLMYEVKTNPCVSISPNTDAPIPFSTTSSSSSNTTNDGKNIEEEEEMEEQYELPDGTIIHYKEQKDLKRLPDLFFATTIPDTCTTNDNFGDDVVELIRQSLSQVHMDVRKELAGNIVLVGGSSLFPEFATRLSAECSEKLPGMYKYRVICSRNTMERRFAPWIGASVLTSLGSFQQLWLSKAEYDEYGPGIAQKRFP